MRLTFLALLLVLSLTAPVFAQSSGGVAGISGVVRDPSGAVVPNAKVIISSEAQGTLRTLDTNDAGLFIAPSLTPGPGYRVIVTAAGFAGYELRSLTLQVGQNLDLKINLAMATASTEVEVSAAAPLVENTKSDVSGVVDSRSIQDLPINGRRVDSFVLLTPGVSNDGNYGLLTFRGVAGQNSFLVDGTDTTEQFYNENAGRTRIAAQISQDAVQEFQVVSSNYSAEYGRAMGGIVNTVTKSGGNALHGTAYWFYRSTGFNARDPFSTYVPSEKRQQAGGSLGGAIRRDKLFYFLNTEITRRNFPMTSSLNTVAVNPLTQTWNSCGVGTATQPAATPAQCAAINALLPRFYGQIPRTLDQELYFGKLDYHPSDRNSFSASFNFLHHRSPNGIQTATSSTSGSAITGNGDDAVTVRNGRAVWTMVPTSTFVNELRFGFAGDRQADTFNDAELGGGLGFLQVSANGTQLGPANYLPRIEPSESRFQFQDNATWTKGTHTIKLGADIATTEDYVYYLSNYFGSYSYQTVNAFALDYSGNTSGTKYWNSYSQTFGNPVMDYRMNDYGFYLQDQWRVTPKLTVSYGARYEYAQLPQPKVCNPDYPLTCHVPSSPTNLAPRLGLSYQLNDKTVLQAGYGMFYGRFQGGTIDNLFTSGNGVVQTSTSLAATQAAQLAAGPVFPNTLTSIPSGASISAASIQMLAPGLKTPYSEQGNIGIQRQLTSDTAMTVSYIWSRGVQLYGVRDLNLPTTSTNFTYTINDASGSTVGSYTTPVLIGKRPDTRYGTIAYAENGVNSYYNGLAVQVNKRFKHGFQAMGSYTWSHEIDDGQSYGESTNNLWLSGASYWLNNGNYKADKGSGTLDQRHRFALSWVWAPTFTHRTGAFFKYAVNNWQLSSVTSLVSGFPYGSVIVYLADTPVTGMFSNYSLNGSGLSSRVPWLPVNTYRVPAMYRSDARLSKVLPITEHTKLYLNLEVFNLANTWAATGYNSTRAYSEAKGVITATPQLLYIPSGDAVPPDGTEARRMQISARFVF
ncbi:MAG TPA: carboxypeptidase regulatory-like domain-containing protein [Bryobacteraceae bacterium]|nr:carboxypeptidase regulatory-like domain-containing protein [Bryobacteraceae bacterium]